MPAPFYPRRPLGLALLLAAATGASLTGQSLPIHHSLNPAAEARSGLYFQPYVAPHTGWRFQAAVDYASMVEYGLRLSLADTSYMLDTEALRLNLSASRDLGGRGFLLLEGWAGGTYNGFLDGFLDWYHGLFGIYYPEREARRHAG